jgi:hypothetical protein
LTVDSFVSLPLSPLTNNSNELGDPLCLLRPEAAATELQAYHHLASAVSAELLKLEHLQSSDSESVTFDHDASRPVFLLNTLQLSLDRTNPSSSHMLVRLYSDQGAVQKRFAAAELRHRDPKSGAKLNGFDTMMEQVTSLARQEGDMVERSSRPASKLSPSLIPSKVSRKGRYGFAVAWSDGATIIYSLRCLAVAAGASTQETKDQADPGETTKSGY